MGERVLPHTLLPGATYRLQFNKDFGFARATEVLAYLKELGTTDVYASPLFQAAPQSTHGYDVCEFCQLNPELGTSEQFQRFTSTRQQLGLGLLLDMVPNHMAAHASNLWWTDVLERGPDSAYAGYFDIDWHPPHTNLRNQVLLPVLGDYYAKVLESGALKLGMHKGKFVITCYDKSFPVNPASSQQLFREMQMPPGWEHSEEFERVLEHLLSKYNGQPGSPRSFDRLHALLQAQHYRLAFWRAGAEEINYRRFFDVTDLVSVRAENPAVFRACHELLFDLVKNGTVTGVRVDHPDGLRDPAQYFSRLQEAFAALTPHAQNGGTAQSQARDRLYVVVEKILTDDEHLPPEWPVNGTTGYDFLNEVNGLFVCGRNQDALDRSYREFTGQTEDFSTVLYQSKKKILCRSLMSEVQSLKYQLKQLAASTRYGQDFTLRELEEALVEVVACFPVYRTYIQDGSRNVSEADREHIRQAVGEAKRRNTRIAADVFNFIESLLLLHDPEDFSEQARSQNRAFVLRFQQLTGPAMAKGMEDTAFYNYHRLISLNEVGGNPDRFGNDIAHFHATNISRRAHWPGSLLATATHDTKRGEDVRARINVLSELPELWHEAVLRWRELNAPYKTMLETGPAPDANDEYLFYQTLVGAWPVSPENEGAKFQERMAAYMLKAIKESKRHTSWTEPNTEYEQGVQRFVEQVLADNNPFLSEFLPFQKKVTFFGQFNSLAQTLLKLTSPGVPDLYQGTEFWDLSLVDPDNRRPLNFQQRRQVLAELKRRWRGAHPKELPAQLLRESHTGWVKLFVIHQALQFRLQHRQLFALGEYVPVHAGGNAAEHICSFLRRFGEQFALVVVPRLVATLPHGEEILPLGGKIWGDTYLEIPHVLTGTKLRNCFTNENCFMTTLEGRTVLPVSQVLANFPVALLGAAEVGRSGAAP